MLSKPLVLQLDNVICLFPFHIEQTLRCPSFHCVSSCLFHPRPTPNPDVSQNDRFTFQPQIPGRALCPDNVNQKAIRAVQTLKSHNYICSVFAPDLVLSNGPAQTTPCYEFIKKLPTLHPFISVSRVCRKPEPHFQYTASHTRSTHSERPQHGWLALYH